MKKIITFGSATGDIFLKIAKQEKLSAGRKIAVDDLEMRSGGGGTNVACGLRNFGFKTAYFGKVGNDLFGQLVKKDLAKFKVDTRLLKISQDKPTALSVIISATGQDRMALVSRGACHFVKKREVPWSKLKKASWFYIASFRELSLKLCDPLLKFAKDNKIKVAVNPSKEQIVKFRTSNFKLVDILFLNKEEADLLGGVKKIKENFNGILAVTAGPDGVNVYQGKKVLTRPAPKGKRVEATGAGDAFASGFLAGFLLSKDLAKATKLGLDNAVSVIGKVGAKDGLLNKSYTKK